ncbi:MFS transporter [Nocardioides sp. Iso805N]|uniref:MFS transporter n=1 Tax=Nocardioides sp. Iso805N TaxID=1283287 RepID=UPI0012FB0028|nr:MFS transporter [Nocardioides sp. Iso805N]
MRLAALLLATFVGMVGYGAVVPYLFADIAHTRHFGSGVAAVVYVLFSLGALIAAPMGARLADRYHPGTVSAAARIAAAAAIAGLGLAGHAGWIWAAALLCGGADAIAQPTSAVVLLGWTSKRRHEVFAWRFTAVNLGIAAGGFLGGQLADLSSSRGMLPLFALAVSAEAAAAAITWVATRDRHASATGLTSRPKPSSVRMRDLLRERPVALLLAVTALLTLGCYAQYESGLPTYALTALDVSTRDLGTSLAINATAVALLTTPITLLVRRINPAALLAACATTWVAVWLILGLPLAGIGGASTCLLVGLVVMALGETVMAPVLTPLAASLAPEGGTAMTVASVTTAQTVGTLAGPAVSGALLALHVPAAFIAFQVICCLAALALTPVLARHLPARTAQPAAPGKANRSTAAGPCAAVSRPL